MTDLNEFIKWQREKNSRSVTIKIDNNFGPEQKVTMWVYDYNLSGGQGQYVNDVSEIDLEAQKEKNERETLKKLLEKYGG